MNNYNSYFPHDSNAKDDPKCVLLIEQLGMEGYGIYWMLVETLRDQPNYRYPIILIPALARKYNTTAEKVKAVVCNYGLFFIENEEFFFSTSLIERMKPLEEKRMLASKAGKASALKRKSNGRSTDVQQAFNECSTSKVKESKVKENLSLKGESAREETNKVFDSQSIKEQLLSDETWKESACMQSTLGISFMSMLPDQIDKFIAYIVSIGEEQTISCLSDAKRRFTYWWQNYGRKEVKNEKPEEYLIPSKGNAVRY